MGTMLYALNNVPAAAVSSVKQPQRNCTEIVFRSGTADNMPDPFLSYMGGTLTFAVVHPSIVKNAPLKDLVYHPMGLNFNFMGMQMCGENNMGKSQGILHMAYAGTRYVQAQLGVYTCVLCPQRRQAELMASAFKFGQRGTGKRKREDG